MSCPEPRPTRRRFPAAARRSAPLAVLLVVLAVAGCLPRKKIVSTEGRPTGPVPTVAADGPLLRIGLAEGLSKQRLGCTGPWELRSGRYDHAIVALAADDTASAWVMSGKIMYGCDLQGGIVDWIVAAPRDDDDLLLWDGRVWRGQLHVILTPTDSSGVSVINVVDMESYLAGVVPGEIGAGRGTDETAAVEAQAVAARTYAAARLDAQRDRGFDLFADVRDQVYGGAGVEDPVCTAAVNATAGLVLRRGEDLVDTYFHSTCGGHTAAIDAVWPSLPDPVLGGAPDRRPDGRPWCADSRYARWREQWSWADLESVLARTLPDYLDHVSAPARAAWAADAFTPAGPGADGRAPGELRDLAVLERTAEGRVAILEITTEAGIYRVRGDQTRRVLRPVSGRPSLLRSAWFDVETDAGRTVIASGRGWGHGIGLCQMGALARARAGQDVRGILTHYYPGARLEPLTRVVLP